MAKLCSPLPMSLPDQLTLKAGQVDVDRSAETWLTGGELSIVLTQVAVLMGEAPTNTIEACSSSCVPVARPCCCVTLYDRLAPAPGGRNPTNGFTGGWPVARQ